MCIVRIDIKSEKAREDFRSVLSRYGVFFFSTSCTRPRGSMQHAYSFYNTASVVMSAYNSKARLIIQVDLDQNSVLGYHLPELMYELTLWKP